MTVRFELRPDEPDRASRRYVVDAVHRFSLPGLRCAVCGSTWSLTGLAYPQVLPDDTVEVRPYLDPRPVPTPVFEGLADRVRRFFPPSAPDRLPPGTEFGPLEGRLTGQDHGDVAWLNPWTPLVREQAFRELSARVLGLLGTPAELHPSTPGEGLVEPFIEPVGEIHEAALVGAAEPCAHCGRRPGRRKGGLVIKGDTISAAGPLFRLRDFPTAIVASEAFAEAVHELGLTGATFTQIAVR